jgi:DNA-binding transcriptional MocR family regulator
LFLGCQVSSVVADTKQTLKVPQPSGKFYRHIVYCVPSFSNPSGKIMSLSHRQKLVQLARKYDALVITDDVYDFLQWPTSSSTSASSKALLPRLVDIDRTLEPIPGPDEFGNAVSNGSFSKISGPGVRTGWSEATPKFTYGLSQCGSSRSGGAPSQMTATIVTELLKSGDLERHIDGVLNPAYKKRYEIMIQAIQMYLIPLGVRVGEVSSQGNDVYGGYFIWLELPETVAAEDVVGRSKQEENLIVAPGHIFEVSNDPSIKFENSLRVCFSWEGVEDLEEGIARLARVVSDVKDGIAVPMHNGPDNEGFKKDLGEFK